MVSYDTEREKFGRKLKTLMDLARLSQQDVADAVGVHQTQVSKWVRGVNTPDIFQGKALARVFRTTIDHLIAEDHQTSHVPPTLDPYITRSFT